MLNYQYSILNLKYFLQEFVKDIEEEDLLIEDIESVKDESKPGSQDQEKIAKFKDEEVLNIVNCVVHITPLKT